ncbi:fluoride efflux transporter CrcB [Gloeobacter violaceus]|uniref:Fluoride-specific ion channel FluC n=1 Tax=Gloeobacter violaceus (strain ATCC 29082 / PCC 7421) TaxID=251221 RepID=FLUC_GLOVI|nr:fluoride efflux transporter CrcB [Gloeobacter violaceus]Q7NIH2.1 RecName: Full=Fluoride-specific ion channel FluC [Gloeobacter violaceus PCC 7421]BAC90152.1 gll2211 [Gloeobacter violaceus PCC 7421]
MVRESVLVMVGGALGSLARYWVGLGISQWAGAPPFLFGTLLVNLVGSFMLGGLFAWSVALRIDPALLLLAGTGFCGGFTTFSALSIECLVLLQKGDYPTAMGYLLGSLLGGLAAGWAGYLAAKAL